MTTASRILILVVVLLSGGCASTRFGTLESVLKGDRLATGTELQEVRVERVGSTPPTTPGMEIRKGDRIVTGPDTRVLVSLGAGYELILEPGTDVEVLNPSLFMRVGQAFVQTAQRVREYLKIRTEFVVAGVEGTQFVATLKGEEFLVSVVEGHVKVESPTGAWPARIYGPMDQGRVRRGQPPERMTPLDPRRAQAIRDEFRTVAVTSALATCRVPPLRGQTEAGAKATLARAGLRLGRVQRSGDSSSARDPVTEQRPAAGSVVTCGTAVAVWIPGRID